MFRKLKYAVLIAMAKNARIRNNFKDAEHFMILAFNVYGGGPSDKFHPCANILYASICLNVDKIKAYESCLIAVLQLNSDKYKNDRNCVYLLYFCQLIISNTTIFLDSGAYELLKSINIKYNQINFSIISPSMKRMFPLTEKLGSDLDFFLDSLS